MNKARLIQSEELQQPEVGSIWKDREGTFYILTSAGDGYCLASLNDGNTWNGIHTSINALLVEEPLEMVPVGARVEIIVGE